MIIDLELTASFKTERGTTTLLFSSGVIGERSTELNLKKMPDDVLTGLRKQLISTLRITEDAMEDRNLLGRVTRRNTSSDVD